MNPAPEPTDNHIPIDAACCLTPDLSFRIANDSGETRGAQKPNKLSLTSSVAARLRIQAAEFGGGALLLSNCNIQHRKDE